MICMTTRGKASSCAVKLPSNEIIRAENLDDDALDEINRSAAKRQYLFHRGCRGSATKLLDLPDSIELFMVKFFREDDISAAPSAFDSDGCIWIYVDQWREHDRKSIALKLPTYEMIFADDCSDALQNVVIDYLKSVEDIIVELAEISETDCTPREYLNVKIKLVDRKWGHGCIRLYTYTGRDFVTTDGKRLDYSSILKVIERDDAPISVFRVELDNAPTIEFDGAPTVERYNDIIIPRRKIDQGDGLLGRA